MPAASPRPCRAGIARARGGMGAETVRDAPLPVSGGPAARRGQRPGARPDVPLRHARMPRDRRDLLARLRPARAVVPHLEHLRGPLPRRARIRERPDRRRQGPMLGSPQPDHVLQRPFGLLPSTYPRRQGNLSSRVPPAGPGICSMPEHPIHRGWLDGTMCQHDFDGRRVFQHPGTWTSGSSTAATGPWRTLRLEEECRGFLSELRGLWSGRAFWNADPDEHEAAVRARVADKTYRYIRVGYDERPLELREDGRVGEGAADRERLCSRSIPSMTRSS